MTQDRVDPPSLPNKVDQAASVTDQFPIAREVAEVEFEKLAQAWEIDTDIEAMDEDDRTGFATQRRRIVDAVMRGRLVFQPETATLDYTLVQPPSSGPASFTIRMPNGAAMMGFDGGKIGQNVGKLNRFIGHMTKQPAGFFGSDRCGGIDLRVFQGVAALFLGS